GTRLFVYHLRQNLLTHYAEGASAAGSGVGAGAGGAGAGGADDGAELSMITPEFRVWLQLGQLLVMPVP
ncbi:MAG: hypothetical protein ABI557_18110, partial [Aureliella sp.]